MTKKKPNFSYGIIIDGDQVFAEEYLHGKKRNIPLFVGNNNYYDVAQACRRIAYALLERADGIQISEDFYHEINVTYQIELMMEENKIVFDQEEFLDGKYQCCCGGS